MNFYEQYLVPVIRRVAQVIEQTAHMQEILHGTLSLEKFRFQIQQNYLYLMDYTRCWAAGLSKCETFREMEAWYSILKNTMESTLMTNRSFWPRQLGLSIEEMESLNKAEGKRSYTSFQLMTAHEGDLAETMMALFPCNILYRYFAEDLLDQCSLDQDNMFYRWLAYYAGDEYVAKTETEIALVNELCNGKSRKETSRLLEIFAVSCNYEILQWCDMYHNMTTWPLEDIFPAKI